LSAAVRDEIQPDSRAVRQSRIRADDHRPDTVGPAANCYFELQ
jgi:hypothetical protein